MKFITVKHHDISTRFSTLEIKLALNINIRWKNLKQTLKTRKIEMLPL